MSYQGGGYGPQHGGGYPGGGGPPAGGMPPQPPQPQGPPPGGRRRGSAASRTLIAAIVLVMVGAVVIAVVLVADTLRGAPQAGGSAPSASPEASPSAEESPSASASDGPEPLNAGWRQVTVPEFDFAYEVPYSDWRVPGREATVGFDEDEDGSMDYVLEGAAIYKNEPCEDWGSVALVGSFGVLESTDTEDSAPKVAERWAELGYSEEDGSAPANKVRSVEAFAANDLTGHRAIVDISVPEGKAECAPEKAVVHTVAFVDEERDGQLRTVSVFADAGTGDALSEGRIDKILQSVRNLSASTDG